MTNMPILYRNILFGLPSEAHEAFLWASDRPQNDSMCYWADEQCLYEFIADRHANYRCGGNVKAGYVREGAAARDAGLIGVEK